MSENENITNICRLLVYEGLKEQEQKQQQYWEDDNEQEEDEEEDEEEEEDERRVPTILTAENYRQQVEEELEQRGITVNEKIRKDYIDPIVQDYFDF